MADSKLYLIALTSLERLDIQFVPAVLQYSRKADHAKVAIIGRNNPKHQYTGGETTLSLTLDFYAEDIDRQDVVRRVTWLESLACSDGYNKAKENVKLVFGKMFKRHRWVIDSVNIKYSEFNVGYDFLPHQAFVDLQLSLDPDHNLTYDDIRFNSEITKMAGVSNPAPQLDILKPVDTTKVSQGNMYANGTIITKMAGVSNPAPQLDILKPVDTTKVSQGNMYANGTIITKQDGTQVLQKAELMLGERYVQNAFYHTVMQGNMLDSLSSLYYTELNQLVPNGQQYWWLIADMNGVNNPLDIAALNGSQIIVPNVMEAVFDRRK